MKKSARVSVELSVEPSACHYVTHDDEDGLEADVYVLDFGDLSHTNPYCVVVYPMQRGWPGFLYSPDGLEGLSHKRVVGLALEAYRVRHADLIQVLRVAGLGFQPAAP
jgi:hypothetical protein